MGTESTPRTPATDRPRTRRPALILLRLAAALAAGFWLGQRQSGSVQQSGARAGAEKQLYTCGMHPQVIQDHPGTCPICGMELTPVRRQPGTDSASNSVPQADASAILIDPATVQNMGVRTGAVVKGPLRRTIRTVATIDYDETSLADVTTKFRGWIVKLHVNATGQQVHRGDPLFEINSPELYSAQTEYIVAQGEAPGAAGEASGMKANALTKLRYFDISDDQIAELQKTRQARKTLRVDAPRDGVVVDKAAVEGQMVDAGMRLYRIADLGLVWVQAQVFEQDVPFIRVGQEALVNLSYLPDRSFRGRVTFIYPTVDEKTRTVRVRMEFHNPGYLLKPGMFATVELRAELAASALLVPDAAVLRSGAKNTVFVALDGGKFEPRSITLGPRGEGDQYQVLSGLAEGERVVTSGQFMLDSESQLREAIQKMLHPAAPAAADARAAEQAGAASAAPSNTAVAAYVCPMPEHVAVLYKQAGKCPLCGMALVPVNAEQLAHIVPGAAVDYYTCPMPEHANIHSDKSGKCPKCGMTMIPVMKAGTPPATNPPPAVLTLYTCPMAEHADVVSDRPGACPKCGMVLVETGTVAHGAKAAAEWRRTHH